MQGYPQNNEVMYDQNSQANMVPIMNSNAFANCN